MESHAYIIGMEESQKLRSALQTTIRPFEPSDLNNVEDIERRSFPYPWLRIEFEISYKRNRRGFLVAVMNGKITGYIIAEVAKHFEPRKLRLIKRGHLLNVAVDPEFRRWGIGKKLVEAIIEYLHEERAEDVWLEVRASNLIAKKFYLAMGFKEKGRKIRYYTTEDAMVMEKSLQTKRG